MPARLFDSCRAAFGFLTILPVTPRDPEAGLTRARAWFPAVGLLLGAMLAALDAGLRALHLPPLLAGALLVAALAGLTRGLHLDGFMDSCDALLGGYDRARRLEILRDPHVGAFAVAGVVCLLLVKFTALAALPEASRARVLLLFPCLSRAAILLVMECFPYLRRGGSRHPAAAAPRPLLAVVRPATGAAIRRRPDRAAGPGAGGPGRRGGVGGRSLGDPAAGRSDRRHLRRRERDGGGRRPGARRHPHRRRRGDGELAAAGVRGLVPMPLSPWLDAWGLDAGALLLALALDLVWREAPAALHPVVWMGRLIAFLERRAPSPERPAAALAAGLGIALLVPLACGFLAWLAAIALRAAGPLPYLLGTALLLKTTFAVRELGRAAHGTRGALQAGAIHRARDSLQRLVSRDARTLDAPQVAMAAIESVAENTTDSYVAPWLAFSLFGLPGAVAYRAIDTLDSMIGYRGRYEYLGKAAARLDDLVNLVPARISAALLLAGGALRHLPARRGWRIAWRDHRRTESPNAGWTIGACAGLLGVALEKLGHYRIGHGLPDPTWHDLEAARRLAYAVAALAMPAAVAVTAVRGLVWG